MRKFAVIVAAGSGTRMGNLFPKQLASLLGRPVIRLTVEIFASAFNDINIIVVAHPDYLEETREAVAGFGAVVIPGSDSRFGSVKAGLALVEEAAIVFVHDGVRCLLTKVLIRRCYDMAVKYGNAVPVMPSVDSLRIIKGEKNERIDRYMVRLVQTPQTFQAGILKKAYAEANGEDFADDAEVAESAGVQINLVEGESTNIKLTYAADMSFAEMILAQRT
jgi:2-C-methyl-D-erythritol 4-phosphate cytidylyltransferase